LPRPWQSRELLTGSLNAYGKGQKWPVFAPLNSTRRLSWAAAHGRVGHRMADSVHGHELGVSMEELQAGLISITIGGVRLAKPPRKCAASCRRY